MLQTTIWGGAGEHGRSSYFIRTKHTRILLDCGVKKEASGVYPAIEEQEAPLLDAVFLSHAHEDHSMALPLLYKLGYQGTVWTTRATTGQLPSYFRAWAGYAAAQGAELPYGQEHIEAIRYEYLEDKAAPGEWLQLSPALRVCWGRSGHLIGSVWLLLEVDGGLVYFSGDYTRESRLLAADWPLALPGGRELAGRRIDLSIVDAAYGMEAEDQEVKLAQLEQAVADTLRQGGRLLLPVPTTGRSQELLVWLTEKFPAAELIVEQPIAAALAQLFLAPEWLLPGSGERIRHALAHGRIRQVATQEQREQALAEAKPCLILSGDGMLETGASRWYYSRLSGNPANTVVLTGHLASGSFGRRMLEGEAAEPHCRVLFVRYKVHQGIRDVQLMLEHLHSRHTLLVHAGQQATDKVAAELAPDFPGVYSLRTGDTLRVKPDLSRES
ncbi:MBL fold metallo-hydrolase [Paenibacillus sp. y28]|uniref:MBL fold metallo-hydrolase n=1 Tax=Paenibacillus sp. y28 TaxID=3129110 RepID=UPI003015C572